MNFARTLTGAIAASVVTTQWENGATESRAELAGLIDPSRVPANLGLSGLNRLVEEQSVMLSTNHIFVTVAGLFFAAALLVWLAPKPARQADLSSAH
jgi:DHA2 family multidrug resistance protein